MGYVEVAGGRVWHEVTGEGPPLVLLHGAFGTVESFGALTPALVERGFEVFVPERRGHGRTPDAPGPIAYAAMAAETVAYLEAVVGGPARLVGWSDGAAVALLAAAARPDLVAAQVLIGQYYSDDGRRSEDRIEAMITAPETVEWLRTAAAVSPDGPEHFDDFYARMLHMIRTGPRIDDATMAGVESPTLVLQGDDDEVTLAHSARVADLLPRGRLAVLPGTHLLPLEQPDLVAALAGTYFRSV